MDKDYASDIHGDQIFRKPTQPEIEVAKRKGSAHEIATHLHKAHEKVNLKKYMYCPYLYVYHYKKIL